jgi:hypothetical protein
MTLGVHSSAFLHDAWRHFNQSPYLIHLILYPLV